MAEYKKFPYRSEFPDSTETARNHQSLEDALSWTRWIIHSRWRETNEYEIAEEYTNDAAQRARLAPLALSANVAGRWGLWGSVSVRNARS